MFRRVAFLVVFMALALSACSGAATGPAIKIFDPWVRAASMMGSQGMNASDTSGGAGVSHMEGANSAAYFVISNSGKEADRLIKAESDIASAVELHVSEMKDGVMSMHPVDGVEIPASGQAELKPGSYHVMFIGIKRDLKPGDKIALKLYFEKAGAIDVEAEVREP